MMLPADDQPRPPRAATEHGTTYNALLRGIIEGCTYVCIVIVALAGFARDFPAMLLAFVLGLFLNSLVETKEYFK